MELVRPDSFRNGTAFFDFTPRIIYKKSRCHADSGMMEFYGGKLNHIWVDLFVIDRLPKGRAAIALTRLLQKVVYGLAMGHRYQLDFEKYTAGFRLAVGELAGAAGAMTNKPLEAMK